MNREMKKLPDSELEVMLAIWAQEPPAHTGEILQRLEARDGKKRKLQAVQIFLGRLVEKGFLRCEKQGRLNYYTPLVDGDSYREAETASFLDKLYGSSPSRLVAALVSGSTVSRKDLEEIRRLLDKGEEEGKIL